MTAKRITVGDKVNVHDSMSKYCGMSGKVERTICLGVFSVRFSTNLVATLMSYQISKNGR